VTGDVATIPDRRAIEALRNGVPNRDAVRVLGCNQPEVEARFTEQLAAVAAATDGEAQVPGLLVSGGFGSGKSHLLEYFQHLALSQNFVVSRVVISKETPLYDPAKVFRAAVESARVPGRTGMAIPEIALGLRQDSHPYAELYKWANHSDSNVAAIFPATLLLHERLNNDPELAELIRNFWAGDPLPIAKVREGLRQIGESAAFSLKAVKTRELTEQRFAFVARLIQGAGYRGWVFLIDEVELVGRYSLVQRGKSYAELARWLGRIEGLQSPGITTVAAVTDDFALAVLQRKGDRDYVGAKLRDRGTDDYLALAARAEAGMRIIEREAVMLRPPTEEMLLETYERLKGIHARAYAWDPPAIASADLAMRRAMRSHVRRWMNEWDLKRLYPGATVSTEERVLRPTYEEDEALEETPSETGDEEAPSETGHDALLPALVTEVGAADGPDKI
jgi:hypothetical protein